MTSASVIGQRVANYFSSDAARTAFWYALVVQCAGTLGINGLFYNDLFVNRLKITDGWFIVSNFVFAIVDPLNDVLLGWWLDQHDGENASPKAAARRRLAATRLGGTLWCLTYLLPYLTFEYVKGSPTLVGLLYFFSRSAFDTALTLTWIALGALIADIAIKHEERVKCQHFASMGGLIGMPVANIAYRLWAGTEQGSGLGAFRTFILCQSAIGIIGFQWATRKLQERMERVTVKAADTREVGAELDVDEKVLKREPAMAASNNNNEEHIANHRSLTIGEYARQVSSQRNLVIFILVNVPQEFLYSFSATFFTAYIDGLLRHHYSVATNAFVVSASSLPINIFLYTIVHFVGTYQIWRIGIFLKIAICLFTYFAGPDQAFTIACFLVLFNLVQASMGGQFGLIITDLCDEDQVRWKRPQNQGARFMSTNALFTKPTGALSPLLGRWILGEYEPETAGLDPAFRQRCFGMMTLFPLAIAIWQAFWWERYDLKGEQLSIVKRRVATVRESFATEDH